MKLDDQLIAPNQVRLWVAQELDRNSNAYNVSRVLRLDGALDETALRGAFAAVVGRHEALRTVFAELGTTVVRRVAPPGKAAPQICVVRGESDSGDVLDAARAFCSRPFDLRADLPVRAMLLRFAPADHALVLVFHHIAVDAWSLGVVEHDLAEAYAALSSGEPWRPPAGATPYSNFVDDQRATLTDAIVDRQLDFWRRVLPVDAPPSSYLATTSMRADGAGPAAVREVPVPAQTVLELRGLCARFQMTPFAVFQTLVQILMRRYSGSDDVVLGTTTLNRKRSEYASAVGFFVNTVALHTALGDDPSFATALERGWKIVLGAMEHDDVPYDQVVRAMVSSSGHERGGLFQVAVEMQTAGPQTERAWGPVHARTWDLGTAGLSNRARGDLTLTLAQVGPAMRLIAEYDTSLFDERFVDGIARAMFRLLSDGVARPNTSVARLELLDAHEASEAARLRQTSPRERWFPVTSASIRALPEAFGDRTAVISGNDSVGFAELVRRAEGVAAELAARGAEPGRFIGVVADRSVASIVAVLGIWLARCAYVPLDPAMTQARRRHVLEDAGVTLVLGSGGVDTAPAERWDPHDLSRPAEAQAVGTPTPLRETAPDDVAYAIYTSGTTGVPKGSLSTHENLANLRAGLGEAFGIPDWSVETVTMNGPLFFDVSLQQLLPLLDGATVVVIPEPVRLDPDAMLEYLARHGVTLLDVTPTHLRMLLDAGLLEYRDPALRTLISGAEALPRSVWPLLADVADLHVVNCYGPTECTVNSSTKTVDPAVERPTIGTELPGVSLYVADAAGALVPYGAVGELHIGGAGLGLGYLNRPDLTASAFVQAPWGPQATPVRVYRTGDRVRLASGGEVEYLGRIDDQVKIRGNRVELGEITTSLTTHPAVATAATIVRDTDARGPELRSFVVLADDSTGASLSEDGLRRFLRRSLPEYMVPTRVVVLDSLPMTPAGKIDRASLSRLEPPRRTTVEVPAVTTTERRLMSLFAEVLGVAVDDPRVDFFDHGGHSLLAARLIARLRSDFRHPMTLATLLARSTPRRLAPLLRPELGTDRSRSHRHLIELLPGRCDEPPLVCVHPLGGDVLVYRELANALPAGTPVYGVLDGATDPAARTTWASPEEMAGAYARELASVLGPEGCRLVGWSLGGLIAHAVAAALENLGVPVVFLAIWDAGASPVRSNRPAAPDWSVGAMAVVEAMAPVDATPLTGWQRDKVRTRLAGEPDGAFGDRILDAAQSAWGFRPGTPGRAVAERAVVCALHHWLFTGWRPGVINAPLSVVWAEDSRTRGVVYPTDWRDHTRSTVHEIQVEGTHHSIIASPTVGLLAENLTEIDRRVPG